MSRSSLEQGRAAFAYAQVRDYVEGKGDSQRSEYRAYLKKLPTLVQTNGLAETMAVNSRIELAFFLTVFWAVLTRGKRAILTLF